MERVKIIAYIENRLSEKESQALSKQIATDTKLAAEVQAIKEEWMLTKLVGRSKIDKHIEQWDEESTFSIIGSKEEMENILEEEKNIKAVAHLKADASTTNLSQADSATKVIPIWRKFIGPLSIAASLLLLFIGYQNLSPTVEPISGIPYEYDTFLSTTKSAEAEEATDMELVIAYFKEDSYQEAIEKGKQLTKELQKKEELLTVNNLIAQSYYQLGKYEQAIFHFMEVEASAGNQIRLKTQVNIAALYVLNKEPKKALQYIQRVQEKEKKKYGSKGEVELKELERKIQRILD